MKPGAIILTAFALAGCAHNLQLMERGTGKVYAGSSSGLDSGSVTIIIDDKTFSGNYVKTGSSNSFGFAQTYGARGGHCDRLHANLWWHEHVQSNSVSARKPRPTLRFNE